MRVVNFAVSAKTLGSFQETLQRRLLQSLTVPCDLGESVHWCGEGAESGTKFRCELRAGNRSQILVRDLL